MRAMKAAEDVTGRWEKEDLPKTRCTGSKLTVQMADYQSLLRVRPEAVMDKGAYRVSGKIGLQRAVRGELCGYEPPKEHRTIK